MVSHLHDSFHSFVFRSILLPNISMSRSPHHRSPPHILLLRPLFFPSLPAHHMSSTIFSSPCHSIYTPKAHGSLSFVPHTQRSSSYFHSIPLEPLTGRQPPLTINLTLAPTLLFAYFSFFGWLFMCTYCCSLSFMPRPFLHCLLPSSWILATKVFFHTLLSYFIPSIAIISLSIFLIHSRFTSSHRPNLLQTWLHLAHRLDLSNLHQARSSNIRCLLRHWCMIDC